MGKNDQNVLCNMRNYQRTFIKIPFLLKLVKHKKERYLLLSFRQKENKQVEKKEIKLTERHLAYIKSTKINIVTAYI